jgi:hypothetical protein
VIKKLFAYYFQNIRRGPQPYSSNRYMAARLDGSAMPRTLLTLLALLCVLVLIFFLHELMPLFLVMCAPVAAVPAMAYAASPLGYAIDNSGLYVERKALKTLKIPLNQITNVRYLPRPALQGAIRIYGTGGLFGWAGRYRIPGLGTVSMHATNLDQLIVIQRRHRKTIVISPADSEAFLSCLRQQYKTIQS